jgi:DNA topoisomerase I
MDLVIVESPAKAKTVNKYLGKDYHVISSFGHVRDLPSKKDSVEPDKDFAMHYEVNKKAFKHVKAIVDAAKKANKIYLASDPDREGEAIAWHIVEIMKQKKALKKDTEVKRIVFHQITKKSIQEAIQHPRDISMDLVNAQQARRALDYLVGFSISPVLWRKLPGSRSAGRVQSVALRLICEREDEIDKFISQEYWTIDCLLNNKKSDFSSRLFVLEGKKLDKFSLPNESLVTPVVDRLEKSEYFVISVEKKKQQRNPYPPFITSTLQQEASYKLGFSAKKTMQIAQKLYEGVSVDGEVVGLITYMRTDGVQLSQDSITDAREYISKNFGNDYLPTAARVYKTKVKNAQEAHEAIRPTHVFYTPAKLSKSLDKDQQKLYELIWKRMIACQMNNAVLDRVQAIIETGDKFAQLKATGSTIAFDGFYKVYKESANKETEEDKESILPSLNKGDKLDLIKVMPEQHFTEPLPRYNEASLVKKLEELGIGRPSTYTSIISVLQDRKYVVFEKKRFVPEDRGRLVTAFLMSFFKRYVEYDFTAQLEDKLDLVSDGKLEWKDLLKDFWVEFYKTTEGVQKYKIEEVIEAMTPLMEHYVFPKTEEGTNPRLCPTCKGTLEVKISRFGPFVGCSEYPTCKYTRKLDLEAAEEEIASTGNETTLGVDSNTGLEVLLKKGPYGFYMQLGQDDSEGMKRATLPKTIKNEDVDLNLALSLLRLPREIGTNPATGEMIKAGIGRFGPYIVHNKKFVSLPDIQATFDITLDQAMELLNKSGMGKSLGSYKGEDVTAHKGKFGPYLKFGKKNIKIPKGLELDSITLEKAQEIIDKQK